MKAKAIFYTVLIILAGSLGLLFNQNLIIRPVSLLILAIVAVLIYFDKEYRNKYIPSVPNWFIFIAIILCLIAFAYSFL